MNRKDETQEIRKFVARVADEGTFAWWRLADEIHNLPTATLADVPPNSRYALSALGEMGD